MILNQITGATLLLQSTVPLRSVTKATQNKTLLGDDTVQLTVESVDPIGFHIGDYLTAFGDVYTLNQLPTAKKAEGKFVYELTLEGPQYSLLRLLYLDTDIAKISLGGNFSLTGELSIFADVLINNIHRALPGWTLGEVVPNAVVPLPGTATLLATKTLSFAGENCLSVMQRLCTEFGTEFDLVRIGGTTDYEINFRKVGQLLNRTYRYGQGRGLYELSRTTVSGKDFITRLYAYGSSKNLPPHYHTFAGNLRLPGEVPYIEKADALTAFGLIEGAKTFDFIFPHRKGTIASVDGTGLKFVDVGMDFDLLAPGTVAPYPGAAIPKFQYLQGGVTAKIQLLTGNLAGYGFEVSFYDHLSKTFTINSFLNEQNFRLPSVAPFQLAPGDTYVLVDILMPKSYLDAAESQLFEVATAYLTANSAPRVQYSLSVSELYLQAQYGESAISNVFNLGDFVQIIDADLAIDKASRVISLSRDVLVPYRYNLTVADSYEVSLIQRILSDAADVKTVIKINDLRDSKRALYGWKNGQELLSLFFDTDGYFDGSKIKPNTIETGALSVGSKSQQLILNIVIEPNYNGNANVVNVGTGTLTHYTIADPMPTWQINAQQLTIPDNGSRYVYAKCNKSNLNDALILFTTAQIKVNDDASYYHFLLGVLHTVDPTNAYRFLDLTYGSSTINGRYIRTGRIQSADGQTFFDLDAGEIGGKITFSAAAAKDLTQTSIDGGLVTSGTIELGQKAGITGQGTVEASVRIWAGKAYANRGTAPFRVLQSGFAFSQTGFVLEDAAGVGLAGISGGGDPTRFWAGAPYADRFTAPFHVTADGSVTMTKALLGRLSLSNTGALVAKDGPSEIMLSVAESTATGRENIRSIAAKSGFFNIAAHFEAFGGVFNFAVYAPVGISMLRTALLNGRQRKHLYSNTDRQVTIFAGEADYISLYPATGRLEVTVGVNASVPDIEEGKEMTFINLSTNPEAHLVNTLQNTADFRVESGAVLCITYQFGAWYPKSYVVNGIGSSRPAIPTTDQ